MFKWSLLAISLSFLAVGCSSSPGSSSGASAVIGSGGGTVSGGSGSVAIPAGALPGNVTITATSTPDAPTPANATTVGTPVTFGPEGQQFSVPVTVTLAFDPSRIPAGRNPASLVVFTAPAGTTQYTSLGGTLVDATHIAAQTTHFSTFVPAFDDSTATDGGTTPDSGTPVSDDAGMMKPDSGSTTDHPDSGTVTTDAGSTTESDAGAITEPDAGSRDMTDAGSTTVPDAGETGETGSDAGTTTTATCADIVSCLEAGGTTDSCLVGDSLATSEASALVECIGSVCPSGTGEVCESSTSAGCEQCALAAIQGECQQPYDLCYGASAPDAGVISESDAGSGPTEGDGGTVTGTGTCADIVTCLEAGGTTDSCLAAGDRTAASEASSLVQCVASVCPTGTGQICESSTSEGCEQCALSATQGECAQAYDACYGTTTPDAGMIFESDAGSGPTEGDGGTVTGTGSCADIVTCLEAGGTTDSCLSAAGDSPAGAEASSLVQCIASVCPTGTGQICESSTSPACQQCAFSATQGECAQAYDICYGNSAPDAGVISEPDAGTTEADGGFVGGTGTCADIASCLFSGGAFDACLAEGTPEAQGQATNVITCLDSVCPTSAGEVCESASAPACQQCQSAALSGGACTQSFDACEGIALDGGTSEGGDAGTTGSGTCADIAACSSSGGSNCGAGASPDATSEWLNLLDCIEEACPNSADGPCADSTSDACQTCQGTAVQGSCARAYQACIGGGPAPDAGMTASCGSAPALGGMVSPVSHDGPPPSFSGGSIADGTYVLTAEDYYGGETGSGWGEQTAVFSGTSFIIASANDSAPAVQTFSGSYSTSGSTVTLEVSCPATFSDTSNYTATPDQLVTEDTNQPNHVSTYTRLAE